jgi:peptidase M28-like protein
MPTALRALFSGALVLLLASAPAAAPTADEIEAGARRAGKSLKATLKKLASNRLAGRDNGSEGSLLAQQLLVKKLSKIGSGLAPGAGAAAYLQPFTRGNETGTNVLAVIPGRELPEEYVMIGAHYDHLAPGDCPPTPGDPGDVICNGATDNASGTAVVLAVGKALSKLEEPPRRSVVLALWDAEEDGLQGSAHYVSDPLVPLEQTVAYVNLDIQGAVLSPSLRNTTIAVGSETGGEALRTIVEQAAGAHTLDYTLLSHVFGQGRSDYANFANGGVPIVFFTDATGACYHTAGDEVREVDFRKLAQQSGVAFRTVVALAEADAAPAFVAPGDPLVAFEDAVALRDVLARAIPADLGLFPPDVQTLLTANLATLETLVTEGAGAFEEADGGVVLLRAANVLNQLTALDCPAF